LNGTLTALETTLKERSAAADEFQAKHKIKAQDQSGTGGGDEEEGSSSQSQGVLI
jgi:hypothetical protein